MVQYQVEIVSLKEMREMIQTFREEHLSGLDPETQDRIEQELWETFKSGQTLAMDGTLYQRKTPSKPATRHPEPMRYK